MTPLSLLQLDSRKALAAHASAWDRLWSESAASLPTLRAASLDQWLAEFAPHQLFRALVVADGERWLAALPFVAGRFKGVIPAGVATSNDWGLAFDLLLSESDAGGSSPTTVLALLAQGLSQLPWGFLSLHHALFDEPRWQGFREACEQAGLACDWRPQLQIARVNVDKDWAAYRATWSKSHRRHVEKYERALAAIGPVSLEWHESIEPVHGQRLLDRGHALEKRGWKGKQGASLHADAQAWNYLQAQAHQLAATGFLRAAFLRVGDRDVAFELGWISKGVYYSFKVAYDDSLAHASPSHVLTARLLEKFHEERGRRLEVRGQEGGRRVQGSGFRVQELASHESPVTSHVLTSPFTLHSSPFTPVTAFDFLCPISPAVAHWRPTTYTVGRALIAPRGVTGPLVVRAQRAFAPALAH